MGEGAAYRATNTGTTSQNNLTSLGKEGRAERGDGNRKRGDKKGEIGRGQTHSFGVDKTSC